MSTDGRPREPLNAPERGGSPKGQSLSLRAVLGRPGEYPTAVAEINRSAERLTFAFLNERSPGMVAKLTSSLRASFRNKISMKGAG